MSKEISDAQEDALAAIVDLVIELFPRNAQNYPDAGEDYSGLICRVLREAKNEVQQVYDAWHKSDVKRDQLIRSLQEQNTELLRKIDEAKEALDR